MNDDWSRCPICFEDYSSKNRPTTFACGHSTCIDHTIGLSRLRHCPICRHELRDGHVYNVSYNLEEAARLFQIIKNTIDLSTIKLPTTLDTDYNQNSALEAIHRDEIYARQLQAELNRGATNNSSRERRPQRQNQTLPNQQVATDVAAPRVNRHTGHQNRCGHACDLVSTTQCCECSDRRPHNLGNRYEAYVDGVGIVNNVGRNEYYCSTCKRR